MAVRFCDKEVYSFSRESLTTAKLWSFFCKSDNTDEIIVVYDDDEIYGICTYELLLHASGNIDACICKEKLVMSSDIFEKARKAFAKNEYVKYLPVYDTNNALSYFCFDDASLNDLLTDLQVIGRNPDWSFLGVLSPNLKSIVLIELNELSYGVYQEAKSRNIKVKVIGEKWGMVNSEEEPAEIGDIDFSMLIVNSSNREDIWKYKTIVSGKASRKYYNLSSEFEFIHKIVILNILSESILTANKIDRSEINIWDVILEIKDRIKNASIKLNNLYKYPGLKYYYSEINEILNEDEFGEFANQIKKSYRKKIATILGNCQVGNIARFLLSADKFRSDYILLDLPMICHMKRCNVSSISGKVLYALDLFIYHEISSSNKFGEQFATDYLKGLLSDSCLKVSISNLYFTGYFPQIYKEKPEHREVLVYDPTGSGLINAMDERIEKEWNDCRSITEVIKRITGEAYFSEEEVIENLNNSFEDIAQREINIDVKMLDYIKENFRRKRLFSELSHPTYEVLFEEGRRILEFIGIRDYVMSKCDGIDLGDLNLLVYPSTKKLLNLEFDIDGYFCNKHIYEKKLPVEGYVELYIRNICNI